MRGMEEEEALVEVHAGLVSVHGVRAICGCGKSSMTSRSGRVGVHDGVFSEFSTCFW